MFINIIKNKRGIALISIYIILTVLLVFIAAFSARSMNDFKFAQRQKDELKAYYAAEAGLNAITTDIYNAFRSSPIWTSNRNIVAFRLWFGYPDTVPGWSAAQRRSTFILNYLKNFPITGTVGDSQYTIFLPSAVANPPYDEADPVIPIGDGVLVKLIAVGTAPHLGGTVNKVIARTVSLEMTTSPIFNYAYFINNFGWLWGEGITANGDVRSNGNFSFSGNPRINGDIYASENADLGTVGTISGNNKFYDIPSYQSSVSDRARPTDPTDPANPEDTAYEAGYDGKSERFEQQEVLDMPYLGNLDTYKQLAVAKNSSITQGGVLLVDNVYDGDGLDGISGTSDDSTIVLIGTDDNPIEINGPVVVEGDIIIRGTITGQGTLYAGRNIHVVGDIEYATSPSWPKPDATPMTTAVSNNAADFMGLACKGNVIIGDYTINDWKTNCERYLQPPFTQGYSTDGSDSSIGYDSDGNPVNGYWFDGNYTSFDGDFTDPSYMGKDNGAGGAQERKYYESSLSDSYIHSISSSSSQIRNIDAVLYNNHCFSGKVGNFTLNGSIISRDEAIIYSGNITMNYDIRAYGDGIEGIDIYLPRDLSLPETRVTQSG